MKSLSTQTSTSKPDVWQFSVYGMVLVALVFSTLGFMHVPLLKRSAAAGSLGTAPKSITDSAHLLLGRSDAPNKLVMFGDYECPPCRAEWPRVERLWTKHHESLAVYFYHFPLMQIHPQALNAAAYAVAAARSGRFLEAHRWLFGSTTRLASDLSPRMLSPKSSHSENYLTEKTAVLKDLDLGKSIGVDSTPTLFYISPTSELFRLDNADSLESTMPQTKG